MRGPKPVAVELTDNERVTLARWARRRKTAQALAQRSRIVLACARGGSNTEIAAELGVARDTVAKWRSRFVAHRLDGLTDEPRPGAPRRVTDEQVESVIVKTLEESPANGDTHWSSRSMAKAMGMSQTAISRIWRGACHDNCVSHGWTKIGRCDRHSVGRGTICESGHQHRRS
jgi:transposase